MNEHSFLPEHVDEQIDALSQSGREPDARLISSLHALYREDREIVAQVEGRLKTYMTEKHKDIPKHIDEYSRSLTPLRVERQEGPQPMKSLQQTRTQKQKRPYIHFLEMLVAVLVMAVLVSGMAFLLKTKQPSLGGHGSATPTTAVKKATPHPTATVAGESGLYIATSNGIDRINLATNKVIWHAGSEVAWNLFVESGIVVFSGGDTIGPNYSNYYVEAVNASDGKLIWRKAYGSINDLQGANGIVYVSSCSADSNSICSIDALKTSTGQKLWFHNSAQGTIWELYQNGVVYGTSYADFFALNATNGVSLWQKTLQKYPYQEATITPLVSGGALYFSSCNTTKQTGSYETCDFFAFNATNGAELWHVPFSSMSTSVMGVPTLLHGVVYVGTLDGIIHAYNAQTGSLLWTYNTGGAIYHPLLSNSGLVYVGVGVPNNDTTMRLLALKVTSTSHTVVWSNNIHINAGKPDGTLPNLQQGLLYILDSHNNILAFHANTGDLAQGYHPQVGASIAAFQLVL